MGGDFRIATPLLEHQRYLADEPRLQAYAAALREVVCAGDVVLDLGCGSGILGLLALRAGARHVYAVDDGPVLELARHIARDNGLDAQVTHVRGHSRRITLPERADVVVADQMAPFALGAGLIPSFRDAARRLLKPQARVVPSRIELRVAPLSFAEGHARVRTFAQPAAGLDVSAALPLVQNMGQNEIIAPEQLLAPPQPVASFALPDGETGQQQGQVRFEMVRAGEVHGLMGCFAAQLSSQVTMSNDPSTADCIDREQLFLPCAPLKVSAGDVLCAEIRVHYDALLLSWRLGREGETPPLRSTFKGMLLDRQQLTAAGQSGRPVLDALGQARLTILTSCAEGAATAEIEQRVWERHSDAFTERRDASLFVAQVLRRNT